MRKTLPVFVCASDSGPVINGMRTLVTDATGLYDSQGVVDDLDSGDFPIAVARCSVVGSRGFAATPLQSSNFAGMIGNGIFELDSRVSLGDILDGSSNAFMAMERAYQTPNTGCNHGGALWAGTSLFKSSPCSPDNGPYALVATVSVNMNAIVPCQTLCSSLKTNISFGASSMHSGGANFLLGDGSVRFVSESIHSRFGPNPNDPSQWGIYQKLGHISDRQTIDTF